MTNIKKVLNLEERIEIETQFHSLVFENTTDYIAVIDKDAKFMIVNPAHKRLGYEISELERHNSLDFVHPDDMKGLVELLGAYLDRVDKEEIGANGEAIPSESLEFRFKDKSGCWRNFQSTANMVKFGNDICVVITSRDGTEKKKTETDLRNEKGRTLDILNNIEDMYTESNLQGQITFLNRAAENFLSYSKEEILKMHFSQYTTKETEHYMKSFFSEVYKTGNSLKSVSYPLVPRFGEEKWIEASVSLRRDDKGNPIGFIQISRDITERKKLEEELLASHNMYRELSAKYKELSTKDPLTGLYNKAQFNEKLSLEIERYKRAKHQLSLMYMDIDNFKSHNDNYGHDSGDKELLRLTEAITGNLRIIDSACRIGGDEFAIILPETTGDNAVVLAERIRKDFKSGFQEINGEKVYHTLSIGVAQFREGDISSFVNEADICLYKAKKTGRDRVFFKPSTS